MAVDRPLELRLEEHVVALPPRRRRTARLKPQKQLAVGAEPPVVVDRNHLLGQELRESERLQQPHDLVIEVHRAWESIELPETLEHADAMPGSSEQRRERLAHRAVADDHDVEILRVSFLGGRFNLHTISLPHY